MAITKAQALKIVLDAAKRYSDELIDRSLLFVCADKQNRVRCLEVTFDTSNFKHLTGLKTHYRSNQFFDLCLKQRLKESDFEFAPNGTTPLKLKVLPRLMCKNLSAKMVGDYDMSQPKLVSEKLAGDTVACIGFRRDDTVGRYVPNTLLKCDIRVSTTSYDRILITYRKRRSDAQYSEIVYNVRDVDWSQLKLPEKYQYLPFPPIPAKIS